jgi:hypothetical protein
MGVVEEGLASLPGELHVQRGLCGKAATDAQLYAGMSGAIASGQGGTDDVLCLPISWLLFLSYPYPKRRGAQGEADLVFRLTRSIS